MVRCPVCGSGAVVVVVSPNRRAFCTSCNAKWIQEGSEQRRSRSDRYRAPWLKGILFARCEHHMVNGGGAAADCAGLVFHELALHLLRHLPGHSPDPAA